MLVVFHFQGLLNAVERELPYVEHRMCTRHIYGNLNKMFPRQSEMKKLFWQVAESYTMSQYEANLELVKNYDMRLYNAIIDKNPKNCNLAFFTPSSSLQEKSTLLAHDYRYYSLHQEHNLREICFTYFFEMMNCQVLTSSQSLTIPTQNAHWALGNPPLGSPPEG